MEAEYGTKARLLRLILILLEQPFRYKKKELAEKLNVDIQTIGDDFDALNFAGFEVTYNTKWRYGFKEDRAYDQLKNLLHFTTDERAFLEDAIDQFDKNGRKGTRIKKKLHSLYDYHKLGLDVLRRPNLQKINILEKAKKERLQIYLIDYHSSNSNSIKNRLVEPLQLSPVDDMLYAYDVDKKRVSHFRLSRISKIKKTQTPFTYTTPYHGESPDPFYIIDENQVMVHLRFGVGAYNELIARFPLTKRFIQPSVDEDGVFDFQSEVNARFLGISNFILNVFHDPVTILDPPELVDHLQNILKKMQKNLEVGV